MKPCGRQWRRTRPGSLGIAQLYASRGHSATNPLVVTETIKLRLAQKKKTGKADSVPQLLAVFGCGSSGTATVIEAIALLMDAAWSESA